MTVTPIEIIPFHHEHVQQITEIYAYHVLHGTASFEETPPTIEEMRERLSGLITENYPILVAVNKADGQVIGYAYAGPHKLRSAYRFTVEGSLYVRHGHLRKGVGRNLLESLVSSCQRGPYHQIMAVIGDSHNAPSIGVHRACGFTHIGTARNIGFKFGKWLDVVYMQRDLT